MSSLFCGRDVTKDPNKMFIIDVATIHDGCQILDLVGHLVQFAGFEEQHYKSTRLLPRKKYRLLHFLFQRSK